MGRPGGGWRGECPALYRHGRDNPGRLPGARRHLRLTGGARKGDRGHGRTTQDAPSSRSFHLTGDAAEAWARRRNAKGAVPARAGGELWRIDGQIGGRRATAAGWAAMAWENRRAVLDRAPSGCSIRHSAGSVGASAVPRRPSPRPAPAGGYGRRAGAARRRPPEASCPAPPRPGQPRTLPFLIASPPPKRPGLTRRWLGRAGRFPAGRLRAGARDGPGPATPPRPSAPSAGG